MRAHEQFELLSAYADGELDDAEARAIEEHLPSCAECRQTLDALRATVADLAALPEPSPSEQDSWALRARSASSRRAPGRVVRAAAAAGSIAAVIIGFVAFTGAGSLRDGGAPPSDAALRAADAPFSEEALDFDADSARGLFASTEDSAPMVAGAPADAGGTASMQHLESTGAEKSLSPKSPIDWNDAIARCSEVVTAGAADTYAAERYIGASFEGRPALLMIYRVGEGERMHRELWVVDPGTCDTLFWAQDDV